MPVTSNHPDYETKAPRWRKIRTFMEGEAAVKAAGTFYLPKPTGMDSLGAGQGSTRLRDGAIGQSEYTAYKERASLYAATARTVQGLTGAVMRKPMSVEFPEASKPLLDNITNRNESLNQLAATCVEEDCSVGRGGLLVDAPAGIADKPDPYITYFYAEDIVNWDEVVEGGRLVLSMVALQENERDLSDDIFAPKTIERRRVLRYGLPTPKPIARNEPEAWVEKAPSLDDFLSFYRLTLADFADGEGVYWQEVWRKDEKAQKRPGEEGTDYLLEERIVPRMSGGRLIREIPWKFINPSDTEPEPESPPVGDLVDLNASHYRNSADHEHGLHMTALPTPWAAGFKVTEGEALRIGSGTAWVSSTPQARAGMVEFTGQGLGAILATMQRKEKQMAILGARMLEERGDGVEAAETLKIRQSGESAALSNIAETVSKALTCALKWWADWRGMSEAVIKKIKVELSQTFTSAGADPKMLERLMQMAQGGLMSWDTFFFNLERAEIYPDGLTSEDEQELIAKGIPSLNLSTTPKPNITPEDKKKAQEEDPEEGDPKTEDPKAED